jgi:hypothetical protein
MATNVSVTPCERPRFAYLSKHSIMFPQRRDRLLSRILVTWYLGNHPETHQDQAFFGRRAHSTKPECGEEDLSRPWWYARMLGHLFYYIIQNGVLLN